MRVVERRRAVGGGATDRAFERAGVVGEALDDPDLAAEVDDLRQVLRRQPLGKTDRRFLRGLQLVFHAVAGVEQDGKRNGLLLREKNVTFCSAPSSNTSISACSRSVTYFPSAMTETFNDTSSTPERSFGGCCWPASSRRNK